MKHPLPLLAILATMPAATSTAETRQLDAHEHGVAALNIAIEAQTVAMALIAPGADIVGFEYTAESDEDRATVTSAIETLSAPLELFALPEAAGCTVLEARATLAGAGEQDEHGDAHHDEHAEHDEHDDEHHDEQAEHDEHDDEHHDEQDEHGDAHHDEHAEDNHNEFHGDYTLTCDNPDALNSITFAYFDAFPNAQEVDVQIITASGAVAFEVVRDSPELTLEK